MKYGILFGLLGLAQIYLAARSEWAGFFWGWSGFSFLAVAAAYLGVGPRLFGKRRNGSLPLWSIGLFLPYFLLTWAVWSLQRLLTKEDCCNEVISGLWVGRRPFLTEIPQEVRLVVDMTAEFPKPRDIELDREYVCEPTLDTTTPNPARLRDLVHKICARQDAVHIHCASGHGRSAAVAAAVLICKGKAGSLEEAERIIRSARPGIGLSEAQRHTIQQLLDDRLTEPALARQTALASEAKLAQIWDTPEEDKAWRHL